LSVAEHVTVVEVDPANCDPEGGSQDWVRMPELSVAEKLNVTVALDESASGSTSRLDGHVRAGKMVSTTTTLNEHDAERPTWLIVVHVTVVLPRANRLPLTRVHDELNVTPATSDAVCVKVAGAEGLPPVVERRRLPGQVIFGGVLSLMAIVKIHDESRFTLS
jgi:hypothetical protein